MKKKCNIILWWGTVNTRHKIKFCSFNPYLLFLNNKIIGSHSEKRGVYKSMFLLPSLKKISECFCSVIYTFLYSSFVQYIATNSVCSSKFQKVQSGWSQKNQKENRRWNGKKKTLIFDTVNRPPNYTAAAAVFHYGCV